MTGPRKPSVMSLFRPPSGAAASSNPQDQRRDLQRRAEERRDDGEESESVATLVGRISVVVRRNVDYAFVHGEVRGFKPWKGTHWFFDLCDEGRKIKCVMHSDKFARVRFDVDDGLLLQARGRVDLNVGRSELRLVVDQLQQAGLGETLARLEEVKAKLRDEGLLDAARKRPLPMLPAKIGIVTSRDGAVIHDMMRVIRERHPRADVLISPTRVQGRGASADITRALRALDGRGDRDVIIVARGGGAREDLYSFDMENVARAIVACRVPVVAGIGHESDVTLAELVADMRAATPTYAAQAAVPDVNAVTRDVTRLHRRMLGAVRTAHQSARRELQDLARALPAPDALLQPHALELESLRDRLYVSVSSQLRDARAETDSAAMRLWAQSPQKRLATDRRRLGEHGRRLALAVPTKALAASRADVVSAESRLARAMDARVRRFRDRLAVATGALEALSPLKVLTRGYGLVERDGNVVTRADNLAPGENISVRLQDGTIDATVTAIGSRDDDASLSD